MTVRVKYGAPGESLVWINGDARLPPSGRVDDPSGFGPYPCRALLVIVAEDRSYPSENVMKIQDFKNDLRRELEAICEDRKWKIDNAKQRGMAFENWCFNLLTQRYPAADNDLETSIIRGDNSQIDVVFESKETEEIFILQCKHPKIAANEPIPEDEVKAFFSNFQLLKDDEFFKQRNTTNQKIRELVSEFEWWRKKNFAIHFIFASSGKGSEKTAALADKFNREYPNQNVRFEVWDIARLKDEFVEIKSVEEQYPAVVRFTLAARHYLIPKGELENITFVLKGSTLKDIANEHKDSLFNWNIRRFLGKKGEVNKGLSNTLAKEPEKFFYYNNGISVLCDSFDFDQDSRELTVQKAQVVNGAQTLGAIKNATSDELREVLVLVKLTAVKHSTRERGIAAELIKTNNTQNTLRAPDFRSNDKIQQWLETEFKRTRSRGELKEIAYGRKRPYPRASSQQLVIKLQDLGKIRYAWYHDPRIPIADPAKLFEMPEEGGLYGAAFGNADGEVTDIWTDEQFRDCLLAIHTFEKINAALYKLQSQHDDLKQVSRLRYYGLKLFKLYFDQIAEAMSVSDRTLLYSFGSKYNEFFNRAEKIITRTLIDAYREILKRDEGTAFSLPRDSKVWDIVQAKFESYLSLARDLA